MSTTDLRHLIHGLAPETAHELKQAYYQAASGLRALAEILEKADAEAHGPTTLLDAHFAALDAEVLVKKTKLGAVL